MAKPDSPVTRLRRHLAALIEPSPDPGEAWCVYCTLNDGRTLIVSADGIREHVEQHVPGSGSVNVRAAWPPGGVPGAA